MLFVAACGGGSDDTTADSEAQATTNAPAADSSDDTTTDDGSSAPDSTESVDTAGSVGDFEPGDVEFRVVNTLDEPVDIYVRTTGLVEAFTVAEGVEPGAVTANLSLDDAQAACAAELLVDAIGVDALLIDGELVDLDALPSEFDAAAEAALVMAITECNIDPASLGG